MFEKIKRRALKMAFSPNTCIYDEGVMKNEYDDLSIIYSVYVENQNAIGDIFNTLSHYSCLSPEIRKHINIIVVDDCSLVSLDDVIKQFKSDLNIYLLRISKNIKWNSGGAKNLGVSFCFTEKIILSDIDHYFTEKTLDWALHLCLADKTCYVFDRIRGNSNGDVCMPHSNTFFMTKKLYFLIHGYDEDYSGFYFDDIPFRVKLSQNASVFRTKNICVTTNTNEHNLSRKVHLFPCIMLILKKTSKVWQRFPFEYLI